VNFSVPGKTQPAGLRPHRGNTDRPDNPEDCWPNRSERNDSLSAGQRPALVGNRSAIVAELLDPPDAAWSTRSDPPRPDPFKIPYRYFAPRPGESPPRVALAGLRVEEIGPDRPNGSNIRRRISDRPSKPRGVSLAARCNALGVSFGPSLASWRRFPPKGRTELTRPSSGVALPRDRRGVLRFRPCHRVGLNGSAKKMAGGIRPGDPGPG
jgi:hypothetical protein